MIAPQKIDLTLYNLIRACKEPRKVLQNIEPLGKGAAGEVFAADFENLSVVLKKHERDNDHTMNEFHALAFLREKMLKGDIPSYYVFMYGMYSYKSHTYLILERADKNLVDYMTDYNISTQTCLYIFWHVANAVAMLERYSFNHGDLWNENVMLCWETDEDDELTRNFCVKLIDYDSAFMNNSKVNNPSLGGAEEYRSKFILGYDLNRFFDSILYSYDSYIEKKQKNKIDKIKRLTKQQQRGKKVVIPSVDEEDDSDREYDACNIIYPKEIIDFIYSLEPNDPNVFRNSPRMSGENVKKKIEELAKTLELEIALPAVKGC